MQVPFYSATSQIVDRRTILRAAGVVAAANFARPFANAQESTSNPGDEANSKKNWFQISLAQWSLNPQFYGKENAEKLDPIDFASIAKNRCGIDAIEYVNSFYNDRIKDRNLGSDLKKRADDVGVKSLLIMCDGEGEVGTSDLKRRVTTVRNHIKWMELAAELGCHSIRVNASSNGKLSFEEQQKYAADGLRRLCEVADTYGINVLVENHGGMSSHGRWLRGVMELVDHPRIGTLPDFGNFRIDRREYGLAYDRYLGVHELMPFAKGVSAKSYNFDADGNETTIDYKHMLSIVRDAGFRGYIGVEFEGSANAFEGIQSTKALLERVRDELSA